MTEIETGLSFSVDKTDGLTYNWLESDSYTISERKDSDTVIINWGCTADTLKLEVIADGTERYIIEKVIRIIQVSCRYLHFNYPIERFCFFSETICSEKLK
ncbi:MAG: hypothetical protein JXA77_09560 [Bacteroidales bacterium]|nr:hypothetical protein [Bacteroidales bacterium]MBN2817416.1 hypothetical protein [Bacteroidales bacterium]